MTLGQFPEVPANQNWAKKYAQRLVVSDFVVIIWTVVGTQITWFGTFDTNLNIGKYRGEFGLSYTLISVLLIVAWMVALSLFGSRASRIIGTGFVEYKVLIDSSISLFGLVAIVAFLLQLSLARGYIITSLPVGLAALIASRWLWRQWLSLQRSSGLYSSRVLLVGSRASVIAIARELKRLPDAGYLVVGVCIPGEHGGMLTPGNQLRVFGDIEDLQQIMSLVSADTVVVTGSEELPPERIRQISWSLEPGRQHLVMAPSLTDVGGPRIHMRPVAGLPLIHVEIPRYDGLKNVSKRIFDLVAAVLLFAALSPVFLLIAVVIASTSPGPILFRQQRIGHDGIPFTMLKFRSMNADAETELASGLDLRGDLANSVMFKMKDDPRITSIGRFLRRYSVDELPQLLNVFGGSMSLVGPRPPLESEVKKYESHVHRRFLVKPGITGLWQVSGRSNLSWEETVRLDLYYVENWSIVSDTIIVWRTIKAVFGRDGAY